MTFTTKEIAKVIAGMILVGIIGYFFNLLPTLNGKEPFGSSIMAVLLGILIGGAVVILFSLDNTHINKTEQQKADRYIPEAMKQEVLRRQGGTCNMCGQTTQLELHHKVPVSMGGTTSIGNLVALCPNHHKSAHNLDDGNERHRIL